MATLIELTAEARALRRAFDHSARQKHRAPWTRAEIAQGFVGDVGALMKLCMAADNRRDAPRHGDSDALAHELADCLWSVLVLADEYGVDLVAAHREMVTTVQAKLAAASGQPA